MILGVRWGAQTYRPQQSGSVVLCFKPKCGPQKESPSSLSLSSGGTRRRSPAGCGFVNSGSVTPHGAPSEGWLGDPAWDLCQHGSFSCLPWTQVLQPVCGGPGCRADGVHEQKRGAAEETGLQTRGRRVTTGPAPGLTIVLEQSGRPCTSVQRSVGSKI